MQNEIIINADPGETRVALLERSSFTELYIERQGEKSVVGNVVKGRVSRVLPGMQAAFVDVGLEKAAFLYVGDYFPYNGDEADEPPRRGRGRGNQRSLPKIENVLREGQEIVVQIAKEPIGSKGARITSHISIPGRHLVLTPWARRVGVSRRIDSDKERRRLREIVERLRTKDLGFIIRTAGEGIREADLDADIRYLTSVWDEVQRKIEEGPAPAVLYSELDLPLKMIRDFANSETKRIAIDSNDVYEQMKSFVERFVADPRPKIEHYNGAAPIFDEYGLESQIHDNLERKVWLKSGGHLVVDQSEALTAIDVNTGRYIGKRDLEETVFKTNLEAVKEVVYQLRFRNIGGLIIIDLIDMESADNREKVYRALQEALRADKARTNILKISELGLVEMTRKRTRENLVQTVCEPCSYCEGRGYVLSRKSVAFKVLREIRNDLPRFCGRRIAITVSPMVAEELLCTGKEALASLGEDLGREIEVRARPGIHQEQFEVSALDSGPAVAIPLRWLEDRKEEEKKKEEGEAGGRSKRRGRRRGKSEESETAAAEDEKTGESAGEEAGAETSGGQPEAGEKAETADAGGAESESAAGQASEATEEAAQAPPKVAKDREGEPEAEKTSGAATAQAIEAPGETLAAASKAPAAKKARSTRAAGEEKPLEDAEPRGGEDTQAASGGGEDTQAASGGGEDSAESIPKGPRMPAEGEALDEAAESRIIRASQKLEES